MIDNIKVFCQSTIKISKNKIIYFDPFNIEKEYKDADVIFITHDHYDHFDEKSILKIKKDNTKIVIPETLKGKTSKIFDENNILVVLPDNNYTICDINFKTVRAYNNNKPFHPKENNWVGYVVTIDGVSYYIMGDTDDTLDARSIVCDVLFIPVGGTYTMNSEEAVLFTNYIKPKIAVPIHYGDIVGTSADSEYFINNLDSNIKGIILKEKEL